MDGVDLTECAVLQAEDDNLFDGIADLVPGCPERFSRCLPRKPTRPTGQKQHVDVGQLMLAVAPRNFFHEDGRNRTPADGSGNKSPPSLCVAARRFRCFCGRKRTGHIGKRSPENDDSGIES